MLIDGVASYVQPLHASMPAPCCILLFLLKSASNRSYMDILITRQSGFWKCICMQHARFCVLQRSVAQPTPLVLPKSTDSCFMSSLRSTAQAALCALLGGKSGLLSHLLLLASNISKHPHRRSPLRLQDYCIRRCATARSIKAVQMIVRSQTGAREGMLVLHRR